MHKKEQLLRIYCNWITLLMWELQPGWQFHLTFTTCSMTIHRI